MNIQEAVELGLKYHSQGDFRTAESIYEQTMAQAERLDPSLLYAYGTLLVAQERYALGCALLQAAIGMAVPEQCAPLWTNLACAYKHMGRDEQALSCYEKALALDPNQPDILAGLSGFWINKNDPKRVEDYARRALALKPDHHAAHMHLGMGLLEQGRYEEAWPHYEYRWETPERIRDKRPYKATRWHGQFINKLAIHGEQGLGDEILFMSLLYKVRGRAETIVIECADRLVKTFSESFGLRCYPDHASLIAAEGEPDAYISMGSLPSILGLPDGRPFLKRPHKNTGKMRVGYTWAGGTIRTSVNDRTIPREMLDPILAIPGIEFVPVQYGEGDSFDDLQGKIASCDLIISVCQTAVHQAGAMGVDCWVLVPERAAWRYNGDDMLPWYRSVKFFRQHSGDWTIPIQEIAASLKERYGLLAA